MIPYMVGKLAPNLSHLTRELVKYVPGRSYFRAVPSQNGDKYVTSPHPPPIVELVKRRAWRSSSAASCHRINSATLWGLGISGSAATYKKKAMDNLMQKLAACVGVFSHFAVNNDKVKDV